MLIKPLSRTDCFLRGRCLMQVVVIPLELKRLFLRLKCCKSLISNCRNWKSAHIKYLQINEFWIILWCYLKIIIFIHWFFGNLSRNIPRYFCSLVLLFWVIVGYWLWQIKSLIQIHWFLNTSLRMFWRFQDNFHLSKIILWCLNLLCLYHLII